MSIEIVEYDPRWPEQAATVIREVSEVLGDSIHGIEHFGSEDRPDPGDRRPGAYGAWLAPGGGLGGLAKGSRLRPSSPGMRDVSDALRRGK